MQQVVQNYRTGELKLDEVPSPACRNGGVLVQTAYSLVSSGTEATAVREAAMSLVEKARARPDQVQKVIEAVRKQGLLATYQSVMNRLDSLTPLGYSMAGVVVGVGDGVEEFRLGQRVACGGVGYANHAEFNFVPKNLTVPVPDGVSLSEAACTTVGAVAMQGFRQSKLSLGDAVVVIGLGLVGQLYLQIAKAAGCRTVGLDLNPERVRLAKELGADAACTPDPQTAAGVVEELTGGLGADVVTLAVGTDSNEPLELAVQLARDRGRIVNVGKAKLDIPYAPFFRKDLKLVFSRSYGPGRYDPTYEEKGIDYPPGYVKWTERRNMAAFLDLVARHEVNLAPIVGQPIPFAQAEEAYAKLREGKAGLAIVFEYPQAQADKITPSATVHLADNRRPVASIVLGCIGAGNYANTKLLPVLRSRADVRLRTVVTAGGLSAVNAGKRFGFEKASSNVREIFDDPEINSVLIATPHSSHARLVCEALAAGKHVFVEKPLCLTEAELASIESEIGDRRSEIGNPSSSISHLPSSPSPLLMVGFNRRFAPLSRKVKDAFREVAEPLTVLVRVNAGKVSPGRWMSDAAESGGRIIGEACHFVDLASFFVGEDPAEVLASRTGRDPDSLAIQLRYPGGSVATIVYATGGGSRLGKEYIEVHGGGLTAVLDDFKRADLYGPSHRKLGSGVQDKGQSGELEAFCNAVREGGVMPIPLASLFATSDAMFKALRSVQTGKAEPVGGSRTS